MFWITTRLMRKRYSYGLDVMHILRLRVDVYESEPEELLRINTYVYPYNKNCDTHCTNLKPNEMIRVVRQNFLTC